MLCVLSVMAPQVRAADETITVETLLRKMTDTRRLAVQPAASERTVQFSSYDRASRLENGKIVHPFANGDRGHCLRVEGEGDHREWVLAEAQGPGYVSRIWSANPDGELRIYLDQADTGAGGLVSRSKRFAKSQVKLPLFATNASIGKPSACFLPHAWRRDRFGFLSRTQCVESIQNRERRLGFTEG